MISRVELEDPDFWEAFVLSDLKEQLKTYKNAGDYVYVDPELVWAFRMVIAYNSVPGSYKKGKFDCDPGELKNG